MESDASKRCQEIIGYHFKDPGLLNLALTHASIAPTRVESNERLEFLGDAVLGLVVCEKLYRHANSMLEGEMTCIKSAVVSRQICAKIVEKLGLGELIKLGKGMNGPEAVPSSVAAAVFESLIGAIYLDGGLESAGKFILEHALPFIEEAIENEHQHNYKSMLQQYAQRHWGVIPDYQLLDEKGPDHAKCFEVAVRLNGRGFPSAWGMNKKESEQEAARRALIELGVLAE